MLWYYDITMIPHTLNRDIINFMNGTVIYNFWFIKRDGNTSFGQESLALLMSKQEIDQVFETK